MGAHALEDQHMAKLIGNLRISAVPGSEGKKPHYAVEFLPYTGRLKTQPATAQSFDDLVALLTELRIEEDEANRYAGQIRVQGTILVPNFERTDSFLKEQKLLG
jgi:hypothetical protein